MSGSMPARWLNRVSESLREHEDRRDSLSGAPPRYEVLGEISRGGMGIVYQAWDPQLGRNVALKVLRAGDGPSAEAHERFQREAKLAAALHHPHIVQIFDSGTWNGQDYIAMQLIEGATLEKAAPDRRQALVCIRDAARALQFAHEQGIVHRDIKPGNLLMDGSGRVYVTDFGVARQAVVSATLTSPGTVVGTPAYMSPEQAQGMPADPRSDVYSLGATLYELIVGRPPHQGATPVEVLEAVRTKDPEPPCRAVPDLSRNVEAIILGAMDRSCDERYPTAAALADDIDRYLGGERPLRRPRGLSYRIRRQFVRHPWRSTAAIVFCALLLMAGILLGYAVRGYVALKSARTEADPERKKALLKTAEPWSAEAGRMLKEIQEAEFAALNERNRVATELALERKRLEDEEQRRKDAEIQRRLQEKMNDAERRELIAQTHASARKYLDEGKLDHARQAIETLRTASPEAHSTLLPRLRTLEFAAGLELLAPLAALPNPEEFSRIHRQLLEPAYHDIPRRKLRLADPVFQLAVRLKALARHAEAVRWFDEAEGLGAGEARLHEQRGLSLMELGDWTRAQTDLDHLLLSSRAGESHSPRFAELPYRQGRQALLERKWAEAITKFEMALYLDRRHARAYHDRGLARFHAKGLARQALEEDLTQALAADGALVVHADYGQVALSLARTEAERLWKSENADERGQAWSRAVTWLDLILERTSPEDPELLLERSRMHRRQGNLAAALEDALRSIRKRPTDDGYLSAGIAAFLDKRPADALGYFQQAGQDSPRVHFWKGVCRRSLGGKDLDGAMQDLRTAVDLQGRSPVLFLTLSKIRLDLILRDENPKGWEEALEAATRSIASAEELTEDDFVAGRFEQQKIARPAAVAAVIRDGHFCRGKAAYQGKQAKTCIEECTAALRSDGNFAGAYLWRGYARCAEEQHAGAQEDFKQALRLSTNADEKSNAEGWLTRCRKHAKE